MKKAKLMLSALAIFAIAGTALAFKAKNFESHIVYTGTSAADCSSAHQVLGAAIATSGTANIYASAQPNTVSCPFTSTVTAVE